MKLLNYHTPLSYTFSELSNWLRDPLSDLEPVARFFSQGDPRVGNRLAADVFETDESYFARFEVPGFAKDELTVRLEPDGTLLVAVERKEESEAGQKTIARSSRNLRLPDDASGENIKAKLENGVLTVSIAKQESKKPLTIDID